MNPERALALIDAAHPVEGWFSDGAAWLFCWLNEIQRRMNVKGDLFEIGVHHGKSALFLAAFAQPDGARLGVCDLFENQADNLSSSGAGNYERFMRNMAAQHADLSFLTVYRKSSGILTTKDTTRGCRFFHIDGGHSVKETVADLNVAAEATIADGLIALDDVCNPDWPSVSEGFFRFLLDRRGEFVPLVVAFNKGVTVRTRAYAKYSSQLKDREFAAQYISPERYLLETLPMFGVETWIARARGGGTTVGERVRLPQDALVLGHDCPPRLGPGEETTFRVRVLNAGRLPWTDVSGHKLAVIADPANLWRFPYPRVGLPAALDVPPNCEVSFECKIQSPPRAGLYSLELRMIQEYVEYFGETLKLGLRVE